MIQSILHVGQSISHYTHISEMSNEMGALNLILFFGNFGNVFTFFLNRTVEGRGRGRFPPPLWIHAGSYQTNWSPHIN